MADKETLAVDTDKDHRSETIVAPSIDLEDAGNVTEVVAKELLDEKPFASGKGARPQDNLELDIDEADDGEGNSLGVERTLAKMSLASTLTVEGTLQSVRDFVPEQLRLEKKKSILSIQPLARPQSSHDTDWGVIASPNERPEKPVVAGLENIPKPSPLDSAPKLPKLQSGHSAASTSSKGVKMKRGPSSAASHDSVLELIPGNEANIDEILEKIRGLSAKSLEMYARAHFLPEKKGLLKKTAVAEDRLNWQSDTMKKPLHQQLSKQESQMAISVFPFILAWTGDKVSTDLDMFKIMQHVIQQMVEHKNLRDEIFCQMCKQTSGNPKHESLHKAWQLLAVACGVVPPSATLQPYLVEYLHIHAHRTDDIGQLARFAEARLETVLENGARKWVPSRDEIKRISEQKSYIMRIYLLDGTYKTFGLHASLSNKELCEVIAEKLRIKDPNNFSLFEYEDDEEYRMLLDDDQVFDSLGRWEILDEHLASKGTIPPEEVGHRHKFVFKVKLVLSSMETDKDDASLHMLYGHAVFHVLSGNYSTTIDDVVKLAGLQMQAEVGDFDPFAIKEGMVEEALAKYVPLQWLQASSPAEWESSIHSMHQSLAGRSTVEAKMHYLNYVKKRPLYGSNFYHVMQSEQFAGCPEQIVMAINKNGLTLLKPGIVKEKLVSFPFSEIVSWAFTNQTFTVVTGDMAQQKKYTVNTHRGYEMSAVCQGYINAYMEGGL